MKDADVSSSFGFAPSCCSFTFTGQYSMAPRASNKQKQYQECNTAMQTHIHVELPFTLSV